MLLCIPRDKTITKKNIEPRGETMINDREMLELHKCTTPKHIGMGLT